MLEPAIKDIVGIINMYLDVYKFSIIDIDDFWIHWTEGEEFKEKQFSNTVEALEWMENNLKREE